MTKEYTLRVVLEDERFCHDCACLIQDGDESNRDFCGFIINDGSAIHSGELRETELVKGQYGYWRAILRPPWCPLQAKGEEE